MSFNGSGSFLINSAGQPVVSGTVISSTAFNALTADLATGLSTCITKDGQTTVTANIPMAGYKFTGLGTGSAAADSPNLSQVQSTVVKLLASVSGADTITAVGSPTVAAYAAGQMFYFVAAGTNTGAVTLNIDSLGAKAVTRDGSTALIAGDIQSGEVCVVVYDGTRFQLINAANAFGTLTVTGNTYLATSSGNVGIGTTSPASKLDVAGAFGTGTTAATITNTTGFSASNIARIDFKLNNSFGGSERSAAIWALNPNAAADNGGVLVFGTSANGTATTPTERARLTAAGDLGIGTTTPGGRLEVSKSGPCIIYNKETSSSVTSKWVSSDGAQVQFGSESNHPLLFFTNNTERARLTAAGDLYCQGVYDNTSASAANVFVASDGLLQRSTSSLKYKHDVQDATHGLSDVLKLRSVTYKGKNDGDKVFGGLIAEEVHEAGLTEFVAYDKDGQPDALHYGNMVSLLVKAVQEQQVMIKALEAKVAALEAK